MSVKALKVFSKKNHPNADSLFVYEFGLEEGSQLLQIVANSENLYEVGDVAIVALVGATLKDGTQIKKARIRGIDSFGMALGKTASHPGCDFSAEYCQEPPKDLVATFVKWPSIELLHHVVKGFEVQSKNQQDFVLPKVTYKAKVKLDGTNGAVQILDGGVAAQSRTQILSEGNDNLGFHRWVMSAQDFFKQVAPGVILFGEWCGRGIQKRTSISKIDRKIFTIFAALVESDRGPVWEVRPEKIEALLPEPRHPDVFVLPWTGDEVVLDFGDRENLREGAETLNKMVEAVELEDPWVKSQFNISGLGEGLVLYPDPDQVLPSSILYESILFKAKGEKHQVVKQKEPVQIDVELFENIEQFVSAFVTENRLEQSLTEGCGGVLDLKKTGLFLKHFNQDVQKESVAELETAGLTWDQVSKTVSTKAREWFLEKVKAI